ncbi:peptidoglycan DD-metalloendopeptidase family protein [Aliivibrio fischeri]|uniref:peptidoglycan DD-metalloendopeptidase family protein n=1 Tax=Aliivibrio fischeri TaxID=668 RepID=UPI0007C53B99|nr:peptidoglycan DD-metalloendopeptidase family protein [Aliivibrio fischeri]MBP3140619.1 peptidoglycan DD-metalloendopeptidase family protein [Aliivibrio fischeri]MBP3156075.1 peptidoglycan DD-metalloendopeptidase family protein [Aliivibrio fischeri]MCE7574395.1 peptidoglycan DD-metalloendopeptidase family protein [Aliivibrio fischeri]
MKVWDEKLEKFVEPTDEATPKFVNAYFPWNEELAKAAKVDVPHYEPVKEKQAKAAEFEYSIEIACAQDELNTYQVGVFSLGKTKEETNISAWNKTQNEKGFTLLTASVDVDEPKTLSREFFISSGSAMVFDDVKPVKKGALHATESFVPLKPSIQVYERLSWPKVGFFYHFIDDELVNEYQLAGRDKWSFKVTHSKGKALSNELLSEHEYSFILLPWKIKNTVIARQHLLYTKEKITQEQLSEINAAWLDENARCLNPDEIVNARSEKALEREKNENGRVTYIVQSGDTLGLIARKQGVEYSSLLTLNPHITNPDLIQVGDVIIIKEEKQAQDAVTFHVCKINPETGLRETWEEIAAQYGMTAKALYDLNSHNPAHKDGALALGDELLVHPQQAVETDESYRNAQSPADLTEDKLTFPFCNVWSVIEKNHTELAYMPVQEEKAIKNNTAIVNVKSVLLQSKQLAQSEKLESIAQGKKEVIKKGAKGDEVKLIQEALLKMKFNLGSAGADGDFGKGTHDAIINFQTNFVLTHEIHPEYQIKEVDGIVGKSTLLGLDEALAIGWERKIPPFKWHEPLLNPMSTNYWQSGGTGTNEAYAWGLFGKKIRGGGRHDGLDLFAEVGTDVYACVDGEIVYNSYIKGYGNVLLLAINESEVMWENRREYKSRTNLTKVELKQYDDFEKEYSKNKQLYLMYAHLDSFDSNIKKGVKVKSGDVIAKTGMSGIMNGTHAPHLHFEVKTKSTFYSGDMGRCNPSLFVDFKDYTQQSEAERKQQKNERDKQHKTRNK